MAKKKKSAATSKKKKAVKKRKIGPIYAEITVTDGKPKPPAKEVRAGELIQFTNQDDVDYLIQLFVDDLDPVHPAVDVLLPAYGECRLIADPVAKEGDECTYNLIPTALKVAGSAVDGRHVIIITSGN